MGRSPQFADLIPSWQLALDAKSLATGTIESYIYTAGIFAQYLAAHDMPGSLTAITPAHVRRFLVARQHGCWLDDARTLPCPCGDQRARSAGDAHKHWRNLRVAFNWLLSEGETAGPSPLDQVDPPRVTTQPVEPLTIPELEAMLAVCSGDTFLARRDTAILRTLLDNGVRGGGLAGLRYHPSDPERSDVFLREHYLRIRLKGGRDHMAPIGRKTVAVLDRYIRLRARHRHAESPWLWLPERGITAAGGDRRLTRTGILQMIKRRARQAGVTGVYTHRIRHTMATMYLDAGGDPIDLMHIGGWSSLEMVRRYSQATAEARARRHHAERSPSDRI